VDLSVHKIAETGDHLCDLLLGYARKGEQGRFDPMCCLECQSVQLG
jgi:hypothetical protein